mgnify:CR=1 FL=1
MHFKKAFITLVAFMAVLTLIACQSTAKRTTSSTSSSIQKGKVTKNPKSDKETGSSCQTASPSATVSESKATSLPDEVMNGLPQDARQIKFMQQAMPRFIIVPLKEDLALKRLISRVILRKKLEKFLVHQRP